MLVNLSPPPSLSLSLFTPAELPLPATVPVPVPASVSLPLLLTGKPGPAEPLPPAKDSGSDSGSDTTTGLWHPAVWRASELGSGRQRTTPSGFAELDAVLPGQGWPHGVLTELLLPRPGVGELRLLAPALAALGGPGNSGSGIHSGSGSGSGARSADGAFAASPRCVMLFDPPARLSAWGLAQQGLDSTHWLVVQGRSGQGGAAAGGGFGPCPAASALAVAGRPPAPARPARPPRTPNGLAPLLPNADVLWALEQSLRSGHVGTVLAWLPLALRADALRRLQLAAQAHDGPVFLLRDAQARSRPSAAPLRLLLQPAGVDSLVLRILKRRGPALAEPLHLALPPVLPPQQRARVLAQQAVGHAARQAARPGGRLASNRAETTVKISAQRST